jgi:assimilatory nitrate reductase catalytic subunit
VRWPVSKDGGAADRVFADGRFFTPDGRARFVPVAPLAAPVRPRRYPLVLNTGRVRDHWHTMTNTGRLPRLSAHVAEPFVELHPRDAADRGILPGSLVEVESPRGRMVGRAAIDDRQRRGSVFVPMHWTDQHASAARIDALVAGNTDPVSGQPGLKQTPVEVRSARCVWHGFAVLAERPGELQADYWALARTKNGWRLELAGAEAPADWTAWARALIGFPDSGNLLAYHDAATDRHRFAAFDGARLVGAIFVSRDPVSVGRAFVAEGLSAPYQSAGDRLRLLAGQPTADRPDPGAIVCSCFSIGINQIVEAVVGGGCLSVAAVGDMLRAGTNCGSCRPEIRRVIDERAVQEAV